MTTIKFELGGVLKFEAQQGYCLVTLSRDGFTVTARGDNMSYKLASGMQVHVQVSYVDASGNPAAVDGQVQWSSSDHSIAEVHPDETDSTKCTVMGNGPVGQAQVSATADADLGEGTRPLVTIMDVEVVAGEAVAGSIQPVGGTEPIPKGG